MGSVKPSKPSGWWSQSNHLIGFLKKRGWSCNLGSLIIRFSILNPLLKRHSDALMDLMLLMTFSLSNRRSYAFKISLERRTSSSHVARRSSVTRMTLCWMKAVKSLSVVVFVFIWVKNHYLSWSHQQKVHVDGIFHLPRNVLFVPSCMNNIMLQINSQEAYEWVH